MKRLKILLFCLIIQLFSCTEIKNEVQTQNIDFNKGWQFSRGEIKEAVNPIFDDTAWETVNVPHDWSIKGPFSKENPSFSRGGWLPTGKCTYRKTFTVPADEKDNKVFIYFDGAYRNSTVYINGKKVGFRPLGYIGFEYDLTAHIDFEKQNVLTVTLDNSVQPGSRWYTGTGIYRDVTLKIRNKTYIPNWSLYVTAKDISEEKATLNAKFEVKTEFHEAKEVTAKTSILKEGNLIASKENMLAISPGNVKEVNVNFEIEQPKLWSPEHPELYSVKVELFQDEVLVGEETVRTGIRELTFDKDDGFAINGVQTKLKGVCLHHDGGPLGAAVYKRTLERQLEILKEMGCNAVRTAHNPFSTEFMEACDEMGILVMNEMFDEWEVPKEPMTTQNGKKIRIPIDFYASQFKEWADKDLTNFVLRDRNHPSVIMWSIGNEIDQMMKDEGAPIAKRLADIVHTLDNRPVTNGVFGYGWDEWPSDLAVATSDIKGYNYMVEDGFVKERKLFPDAMAVVTECQSTQSFYPRGTYLYGKEKEEWLDALQYENTEAYNWIDGRGMIGDPGVEAWKAVKKRPNVMGQFIWTGWDYLGEVIPFGWPARSSSFAPLDLCGFKKDGYYFYKSQWTEEPMVHIFPHWNLEGQEGKEVTVFAYTNAEEVELFQDGKSLGKKANDPLGVEYQQWKVVYTPGTLEAIAYQNGKKVATKEVKTAGVPAKIELFARRSDLKANGEDLAYIECTVLDADGNVVPKADNLVKFSINGEASIIGVGNGNNMSHESFQASERKAFNGKCLAIIKTSNKASEITFTANAVGLQEATMKFKSTEE